MDGQVLVNQTQNAVRHILDQIEAVQGDAAALVQRWNKLGGATSVAAVDWEAVGVTQQEFADAMASLGTLFPDIMGAHGTNLYKIV